ncbi:MAG: XTP/dITP diphosphohydrolase [Psychromonas sp.]|jgi:XTP/dITP diphosphohydrolase
MKLIFATHNLNKAKEISNQLKDTIQLMTLNDLNLTEEIPETGSTLSENAKIKSSYVVERFKMNCFADDTGLEIEALNGEPGVYSARYAGLQKSSEGNMDLVLKNMEGKTQRNAQFKTMISLYWDGEFYEFEGIVEGQILTERTGKDGFGYDPIFQPNESKLSFAQMTMEEKNLISHRGRAVKKMVDFINDKLK